MIQKKIFLLLSLALLMSPACTYYVEEELYPPTDCETNNVTYSGTIVPILEINCYICHGTGINTGGITLEGYSKLMIVVNTGQLLGAIRHEPGYTPMPEDQPQLSDCNIEKIERWISDGALDN